MRILIFKYEKIELLVCIYEISGELVFIYGISGWSSPFGSVHVLQQENNQTKVLIKYFHYDSKMDFSIGLAQSSTIYTFQTVRPEECR